MKKMKENYPINLLTNCFFLFSDLNPKISLSAYSEENIKKVKDKSEQIDFDSEMDKYANFIPNEIKEMLVRGYATTLIMYFTLIKYKKISDENKDKYLFILLLLFSVGSKNSQGEIEKF
jgi:hypothetical protein